MRKKIIILLVLYLMFGHQLSYGVTEKTKDKEKSKRIKSVKQVIVSASRVEEDASKIANDIVIITNEEIKEKKLDSVVDVLRTVPDIHVIQNGPFGGLASVYLRGVSTGQTLVMINGMKVFDPMSTNASFNAAHMSTDNIERIEILKGPQSVLYGSHAIGGVINIITKRGKGKPKIEIDGAIGSWRTKKGYVETSGSCGPFDYAFSTSGLITDGISRAQEREEQGERDFYKRYNFDTRLDWNITEALSLGSEFRYNYGWFKFDDGANQDDPNKYGDSEVITFATYLDAGLFDWWKSTASFAALRYRRSDNDQADVRDNEDKYSFFHGKDFKVGWQNSFFIYDIDTVTSGLEFEYEQGNSYNFSNGNESPISKKFNETKSFFINNVFHYWGLYLTTGLRCDHHSRWDTQNTYRLAAAYNFDWANLDNLGISLCNFRWSDVNFKTKIRGAYATGFKSPSIYQLYSPYGKSDLKPEKSWGWEIGVEQNIFGDKLFGEITYFETDIKDLINWSYSTSAYDNEGSAEMSGYEISFHFIPVDWLKVKGGYAYFKNIRNKITKERLTRRPKEKFSLNIDWRIFDYKFYKDQPIWANVNFNTMYVGNRYDKTSSRWELLQSYWKFDMVAEVGITEYLSFYYKVDNLTDRFYEEVYGYQTPPRNHMVGFKAKMKF